GRPEVPDLNRAIFSGRGQALTVRAEDQSVGVFRRVLLQQFSLEPAGQVPEPDAVLGGQRQPGTVRANRRHLPVILVSATGKKQAVSKGPQRLACGGLLQRGGRTRHPQQLPLRVGGGHAALLGAPTPPLPAAAPPPP